jgi:hypothetical protein
MLGETGIYFMADFLIDRDNSILTGFYQSLNLVIIF